MQDARADLLRVGAMAQAEKRTVTEGQGERKGRKGREKVNAFLTLA